MYYDETQACKTPHSGWRILLSIAVPFSDEDEPAGSGYTCWLEIILAYANN
jgi:hypothetical protein